MNNTKKVRSIITTKSSKEISYIQDEVLINYKQDISKMLPVFLKIKDFEILHDPTFKPYDIVSSWWQYNKIPIIILDDFTDLNNLPENQKELLEYISVFIN